jgi:hypothetical protein
VWCSQGEEIWVEETVEADDEMTPFEMFEEVEEEYEEMIPMKMVEEMEEEPVELPSDFWSCLENYEEGDCRASSCTYCHTQVGIAMCLSTPVAKATKECGFFDCEFGEKYVKDEDEYSEDDEDEIEDPFDPACAAAGMGSNDAQAVCEETNDSQGSPCVWCDAAGVFGLCLSTEQANAAGKWLDCSSTGFTLEE